jgi:tetratricopeptide (TPR) repeat protein
VVALSQLTIWGVATLLVLALPLKSAWAQSTTLDELLQRHQADPQNGLLCEQIGVAYTRMNDLNHAAVYFRKAVAIGGGRVSARKNLATVLWFLGEKNESSSLFESLEKIIPNDPVPQLYLALGAYDKKNIESAAVHFERAGAVATDNPETLPLVIDTWLRTNRSEAVKHLLEARIATGARDAQTYRWLGAAYDHLKQPDQASAAYSEALNLEPKSEENYLALAGFALDHANPGYARKILEQGLAQVPRSAKLLVEMGLAWAIQGDFERARSWFKDANGAQADWPLPLLALGVTDLQTGNAAAAAESFREAREFAPNDYRCFYLHALALKRSHDENDVSVRATEAADLRRAIQLEGHFAKARVALAETEIADGATADAETQLRAAIQYEPDEPSSYYRLALLCRREGKSAEAARLLRTFEQLKTKAHAEENEFVLLLKVPN